MSDFSFDGVSAMIDREYGATLRGEISVEQEAEARKLMQMSERRRVESIERHKRDGIVPFMRSVISDEAGRTIEGEVVEVVKTLPS
jgi:hypothetical protein